MTVRRAGFRGSRGSAGAARAGRRARARRLAPLVVLAAVVGLGIHVALPALAGLERSLDVIAHADLRWIAAAGCFSALSPACYVAVFRFVAGGGDDGARLGWSASYRASMASQAASTLVTAGGAGGIALLLWVLARAGLSRAQAVARVVAVPAFHYVIYLGARRVRPGSLARAAARERPHRPHPPPGRRRRCRDRRDRAGGRAPRPARAAGGRPVGGRRTPGAPGAAASERPDRARRRPAPRPRAPAPGVARGDDHGVRTLGYWVANVACSPRASRPSGRGRSSPGSCRRSSSV